MHWWHSAFSSKTQSRDDSVIVDDESRVSMRSGLFPSRWNRPRKVRQVSKNNDVDVWRSLVRYQNSNSKAVAPASPQPLPLPELRALLQQDPKVASSGSTGGVPLPAPNSVQNQRGIEEKDKEREATETGHTEAIDGGHGLKSKSAGHDPQTNAEHFEARSCRNSMQKQKPKARSSENFNFNIPNSAPSSPYSRSPSLSPPRGEPWPTLYPSLPRVIQPWSSPDMPYSDGNPGQGFSYQPAERNASNFDNSPHPSSGVNSPLHVTSPPWPVSPLTTKVPSDSSPLPRWESNIHATVKHPLPRPPVPSMSSQTTPVSPVGSKSDFPGPPMTSQSAPISPLRGKPQLPAASIPTQPSPISPGRSKPEVMPRKSQWQKGKLIGRGTFGSVYAASNRETGALCAMKVVEILQDDFKSQECLRQLEQEINVLKQLKHRNIVQYYGSEIVGDKFYIYLEYVHPGSINKFIREHCGAITESVVRNFTRHILYGLAYLHSTKTIHRDIKGANLLVDAHGVVKLADFGMAKHFNLRNLLVDAVSIVKQGILEATRLLTGQTANLSLKGSPHWMAPELLQSPLQTDANSDSALAVDIWSLGCTIIEMMNGKPPWSECEGPAALFKVLKETPPIPETLSDDGKDFLQCCFRRNPADRPSASKLLEHPFVSQSYHPESSAQPFNETRLMDNVQLPRELPRHKSDQLLEPFDTQTRKGKLSYNFALDCFSPVRLGKEVVSKHSI